MIPPADLLAEEARALRSAVRASANTAAFYAISSARYGSPRRTAACDAPRVGANARSAASPWVQARASALASRLSARNARRRRSASQDRKRSMLEAIGSTESGVHR